MEYDGLISIIIPCYNEEGSIGETLDSIYLAFSESVLSFEVVVVDNLSSDRGVDIANACGAKVMTSSAKTVAGVRNDGVRFAAGDLLVFLDADIRLDRDWCGELCKFIRVILDQRIVFGAHCLVPSDMSGMLSKWYLQIQKDKRDTHLGSGHMVISRKFFEELKGFNSSLVSGEDYDLCQRAKKNGGRIVVDPELKAVHSGYPLKIREFIKRESWHGMGDVISLKRILRSKSALSSFFFLLFHFIIIVSFIQGSFFVALLSFVLFFAFMFFVLFYKFRGSSFFEIVKLFPVLYFYFLGRLISIVRVGLLGSK